MNAFQGKIYGGVWVVLASAIALAFHFGPAVAVSFGIFFLPIQEEFGWNRGDISLAFAVVTLGIAIAQPLTGSLIDRYGVKRIILPAVFLMGLGLMSFYFLSDSIWHFYLVYLFLGVVGSGTTSVPYAKVISRWFDKRRGLALALAIAGSSLGIAIIPPFLQMIIGSMGWRAAYVCLGAIVILVTIPVVALLLKESPEAEESTWAKGDSGAAVRPIEPGLTRAEAFKTSTAWFIVVAFICISTAFHACLVHLIPLLRDQGVSAEAAAGATSVLAIGIIIGRIGTGFLLDRFFAPYIAMAVFSMFSIAMVLLWLGGGYWVFLVGVILLGLAQGAEFDIMAYMVSRYFGLKQFAAIYGVIFSAFTLGGAIGPPLMGFGFESTGSYDLPLVIALLFPVLAVIMMTRLGTYPKFAPVESTPKEPA